MKVLFCLASAQSAPTITPLAEIKPDKVVLVVTQKMQEHALSLIKEIKGSGYQVEEVMIDNEASLTALNEQFSTMIENYLDDNDSELLANITGGTKLMSIALYQLSKEWGFRSFYCDNGSNQMIWLDDESAIANISSKISPARLLRSKSIDITKDIKLADIDINQKRYAKMLHERLCMPSLYDSTCALIGKIHAHTNQNPPSENDLKKFKFDAKERAFLQELMDETQLFELQNGRIICDDIQNKKFMNGAWLEFLVGDSLRDSGFRNISLSVEIAKSTQRKGSTTRQEIDVMAMKQENLVIIECKAKNWNRDTAEASESIYKLGYLDGVGGILNTLLIFVSLRDLPPAAKTRASEKGIVVIAGKEGIASLRSQLSKV